ncbi:MAG: hypothetical protein A3F35_01140 [Candidatus Woykebacteria bacterium RIFCSPHIGHO2_12_FULL_45_10]|uniref:MIP18 family-like domain-containing protein n=1 Tax=Candidatus Woykebacteria bacterium RIFCSPHIGHO2_12_FULL_45_10 TaxID=1802603 RepID=A0A1G1WNI4_9BACT|nr:MAG: hypothetical protein A3F35_01140 [Candidatus Woykebacteria bacterium RIFCSPHIGHO2_12_FULL_45_10]
MISKDDVYQQLKSVKDPELGINIVDLGLIYSVFVKKNKVKILMTLTFPGCPFGVTVHSDIKEAVQKIPGVVDLDLKITFDPPWDLSKVAPEVRAELGF